MSNVDPEILSKLVFEPRWTAATKLDLDAGVVGTWDEHLVRDVRLLVPIDVQALVVGAGTTETMVRLPSALNDPSGQGAGFPAAFDGGSKRPPGVHLHWAVPDALLRGQLAAGTDSNRLSLPPLPDRWVVLRLLTPVGATQVVVRGWVLEAERAVQVDLDDWPAASEAATPAGATIATTALTGTAGGAATWSATYDSVVNRFSLHDPLDDLAALGARRRRRRQRDVRRRGLVVGAGPRPARRGEQPGQPRRAAAVARMERGRPVGRRARRSAFARRDHAPARVGRAAVGRPLHDGRGHRASADAAHRRRVDAAARRRTRSRSSSRALRPHSSPIRGGRTRRCSTAACTACRSRRPTPAPRSTTGPRRSRCASRWAATTTTCSRR